MLLLGLVIVSFIGKGLDYYRLTQDEASLRVQFTQEYRVMQPGDSREILDPVGAVNSIRRGLGAGTTTPVFLASLGELATAMAANSDAAVEAVSYRAGVIDVRITTPDVETVGNIQKSISESGQFTASIQSTDRVADRINSRIQIREAGS